MPALTHSSIIQAKADALLALDTALIAADSRAQEQSVEGGPSVLSEGVVEEEAEEDSSLAVHEQDSAVLSAVTHDTSSTATSNNRDKSKQSSKSSKRGSGKVHPSPVAMVVVAEDLNPTERVAFDIIARVKQKGSTKSSPDKPAAASLSPVERTLMKRCVAC